MALTHVTESVAQRMLADASAKSLFPSCLALPAQEMKLVKKKCGRCGGQAKAVGVDFNEILACLASLPREGKLQLKVYLGAAKVRVRYRRRGKTVIVTW